MGVFMQLISMAIVGLIVGILARFFYPGAVPMGLLESIALGILGSFVAALLVRMFSPDTRDAPFRPAGCLASILGAILVIFVARHFLGLL
jgi:uncharacterized membrane protein YeaQ/YmgE (transglycosylase-associated protein family)